MVNLCLPSKTATSDRRASYRHQNALRELAWGLEVNEGEFAILLARCNSLRVQAQMLRRLRQLCSIPFDEIVLDSSANALYTAICSQLTHPPHALSLSGFTSVSQIDRMLLGANFILGEFYRNFHFPSVWWVTDDIVGKLIRLAPDLYSRTTAVEFDD
jgi:hypothetical protein